MCAVGVYFLGEAVSAFNVNENVCGRGLFFGGSSVC